VVDPKPITEEQWDATKKRVIDSLKGVPISVAYAVLRELVDDYENATMTRHAGRMAKVFTDVGWDETKRKMKEEGG